jgi:tape measure domain-containing protein
LTQVIQDHTIKIGFDGSAVVAGINQLQAKLNNLKVPKINLGMGSGGMGIQSPLSPDFTGGRSRITGQGSAEAFAERVRDVKNTIANFEIQTKRRLGGSLGALQEDFDRLKRAITTVGTDRGSLRQVTRDISTLRTNVAGSVNELRAYERQARQASRVTDGFDDSIVNLGRSFISVFAIIEAGKTIFKLGKEMDSLNASMLASSNGSKQAAENLLFIKQEANRLGIDLVAAAQGFTKIGAVTKSLNVPMGETRELFTGISEVSRAFNLSTEDTKLAFLGFSQALSKGVLSMQEVRQQIGERIPIALEALSKSMGVTTPQMNKMIESGTVLSKDVVPKWVEQMQKMVKETGALEAAQKKVVASQARFQNSVTLLSETMFTGGGATFMKAVFDALSDTVEAVRAGIELLAAAFSPLAKAFGGTGNAVEAMSFALKVLVSFMILKLIPANNAAAASAIRGGTAMRFFGSSMLFAAAAAKTLLRALGIGLAIEAIGFAGRNFIFPETTSGTVGASSGTTSTTNNVQFFVTESDNPQATAQANMSELANVLAMNSQNGDLA